MLVAAGYSHCFCTPHAWPSLPDQTREIIPRKTAELQSAMLTAGVPLTLLPGSELSLHPKVMETQPAGIIPLGLADRFILVDMWADRLPEWFTPAIRWLQGMGLKVVLAHPERMRAVQDHPELADTFDELGILLQGNLQCFADRPEAHTRITAERYLRDGRYFVLGSDTHNPKTLDHRLTGLRNAIALAGDEAIDKLTRQNPRAFLPDGVSAD